jgi:hypothetical protein
VDLRTAGHAGLIAGAVSGTPSTLHALCSGGDPWQATLAAGSLLLPRETRSPRLVASALVVHGVLSLGWAAVLTVTLPPKHTVAWGAVAGTAIAALDLGVVGRRNARIRALPGLAQLADHVAFGATVGAVVSRRRGVTLPA